MKEEVSRAPSMYIPEIGRAWVLVGLLRLHLLLPQLPVDPATKAGIKALLLQSEVERKVSCIAAEHILSAIAGGTAVNSKIVDLGKSVREGEERLNLLNSRAVERPESVVPFSEVFFELKDVCDSLGSIERVFALVKRITDSYNTYSHHFGSSPATAKAALDDLRGGLQEELAWQGNVSSFIDRVRGLASYDDIVSPTISALQNISSGLRLISGYFHSKAESISSTGNSAADNGIRRTWRSILQYPFSVGISLDSIENFSDRALAPVSDLLASSHLVVARAMHSLTNVHEAQGLAEGSRSSKFAPSPPIVDIASSSLVLLLALSRIDYLVGGGTLSPSDAYVLFNRVLDSFVERFLRGENERRRREAEKAALFRNKVQEKTLSQTT